MQRKMEFRNLYETLVNTAERFPDKPGVADGNGVMTFDQLLRRVDEMASFYVKELKLGQDQRIGILMENCLEFVIAVYAAAKTGIVTELLNVKQHGKELIDSLKQSGVQVLLANCKYAATLGTAVAETEIHTLVFDRPGDGLPADGISLYYINRLPAWIKEGEESQKPVVNDENQPLIIISTSGTGGTSKSVQLTHRNILETVATYKKVLHLDEEQSALLAVPAFHVTGFSCVMALFIYLGGFLILQPAYHTETVLRELCRYRITHFHAVPTVFQMLINGYRQEFDLSSLTTAVCGGGPIEDEWIERFSDIAPNASFHPAYGMTETAGGGVLFPEDYLHSSKRGAAGKVMENCQVAILDDKFQFLPRGEVGQIAMKGPMVAEKYLREDGGQHYWQGWLLSGDLGCLDAEGFLYIKGRLKAMINCGGEKIYSRFVEQEILSNKKVEECAVFPVKDRLFGEVPGAVVVVKAGERMAAKELREFLSARMRQKEVPQYMEIRKKLPRTASGKVNIGFLVEEFNRMYDWERREEHK